MDAVFDFVDKEQAILCIHESKGDAEETVDAVAGGPGNVDENAAGGRMDHVEIHRRRLEHLQWLAWLTPPHEQRDGFYLEK